jgi:hypothetical protein
LERTGAPQAAGTRGGRGWGRGLPVFPRVTTWGPGGLAPPRRLGYRRARDQPSRWTPADPLGRQGPEDPGRPPGRSGPVPGAGPCGRRLPRPASPGVPSAFPDGGPCPPLRPPRPFPRSEKGDAEGLMGRPAAPPPGSEFRGYPPVPPGPAVSAPSGLLRGPAGRPPAPSHLPPPPSGPQATGGNPQLHCFTSFFLRAPRRPEEGLLVVPAAAFWGRLRRDRGFFPRPGGGEAARGAVGLGPPGGPARRVNPGREQTPRQAPRRASPPPPTRGNPNKKGTGQAPEGSARPQ